MDESTVYKVLESIEEIDHYDKCLVLTAALSMQMYLMGETSMIFVWPKEKLGALSDGIRDIGRTLETHACQEGG